MKIISLGWGVQSWTLASMVALGELEPVDFVIHSDTTWERSATYKFAEAWTPWLKEKGVKVVTVKDWKQAQKVYTHKTDIPAFTAHAESGIHGQLRRQCTGRWKITPMRRYISAQLNGRKKTPGLIEQWLGITLDEWQRAKDSDVKYIKHRFPLLEMNYTRADCLAWLERHGLPSPGKSACTFCPYHNRHIWERMKRENGADWKQAVDVDSCIRDKRPPYSLFVHPYRKPLDEAVIIPEDYGYTQLSFLESNDFDAECDSGYCFL